jgi:hypothetical protein
LCRDPKIGDDVVRGSRWGKIAVVIRHQTGNQVRVQWDDEFYRPFYVWSELIWDCDHWEIDPPWHH